MTEGHVTNLPSPLHQHPDLRGQDPLGQGGVRETQLAAERRQRERDGSSSRAHGRERATAPVVL